MSYVPMSWGQVSLAEPDRGRDLSRGQVRARRELQQLTPGAAGWPAASVRAGWPAASVLCWASVESEPRLSAWSVLRDSLTGLCCDLRLIQLPVTQQCSETILWSVKLARPVSVSRLSELRMQQRLSPRKGKGQDSDKMSTIALSASGPRL